MHEAVSDILIDRAKQAEGMHRMLVVSLAAHALAIAGVIFMPADWLPSRGVTPSEGMVISISGIGGPESGGMTPISGRPVQEVAEAKPEPVAPPAPARPEMIDPEPTAKPAPKKPVKPIEKPVEDAKSRTPAKGPEPKSGAATAAVPFGAQSPVPGLSSGGAPGGGQAYTDYANFCCPQYLNTMVQVIRRNWNDRQGAAGLVLMKFTILRDGRIIDIEHEKASGVFLLDRESQRALSRTTLPPLPREFSEDRLTVHLYFQYQR